MIDEATRRSVKIIPHVEMFLPSLCTQREGKSVQNLTDNIGRLREKWPLCFLTNADELILVTGTLGSPHPPYLPFLFSQTAGKDATFGLCARRYRRLTAAAVCWISLQNTQLI